MQNTLILQNPDKVGLDVRSQMRDGVLLKSHAAGSIVIVSGLPRSGTSMMMAMLQAGGIEVVTDALRRSDEDNPQGYYELERVKSLPTDADRGWLASAEGKAIKIISSLLKHLPPTFSYDVIFMNRDLNEVVVSQRKMLIRRGEDMAAQDEGRMKLLFQRHLEKVKTWLSQQPNFRLIDVAYKEVLENPLEQGTRIGHLLGRSLRIEPMVKTVDNRLYRNRG